MSEQIQCPNCGSYKIRSNTKSSKLRTAIAYLLLGPLIYYLGYVSPTGIFTMLLVVGAAMMVLGLAFLILTFIHKTDKFRCKSCNKAW